MLHILETPFSPIQNQAVVKDKNKTMTPQMQILRYMGNKRGLLKWLLPKLKEYLDEGETLLDLFAGTASVGYALKPYCKIITNDIQSYSYEISKALLNFNGTINEEEFETYLSKNYQKNLKQLYRRYKEIIEKENSLLNNFNCKTYLKFSDTIPSYCSPVKKDKFKLNRFTSGKYVHIKRRNPGRLPFDLFTIYFANTFFGIRQAVEIDSLRYAINQISDDLKKSVYLTCLLYAISKAVNSSGHFAEYFDATSIKSQKFILEHRKVSVETSFKNKLNEFRNLYRQNQWKNEVYKFEYRDLIKYLKAKKTLNKIRLIYIDPPYTTAQYSRFYHIPETLIKYDYPEISLHPQIKAPVKGKYRHDRYWSSFSRITEATKAFTEMFGILANSCKATLAVSYSDNSIIKPITKLIDIASKYYIVTDISNGYIHSAQGSRFRNNGKGNQEIHEHVLICKSRN